MDAPSLFVPCFPFLSFPSANQGKRPYHTIIPCMVTSENTGELFATMTNMVWCGGYSPAMGGGRGGAGGFGSVFLFFWKRMYVEQLLLSGGTRVAALLLLRFVLSCRRVSRDVCRCTTVFSGCFCPTTPRRHRHRHRHRRRRRHRYATAAKKVLFVRSPKIN